MLLGFATFWPGYAGAYGGPVFDGDADGIADERDACLDSPPGSAVGADGCSPATDHDGDGVSDAIDLCPQSPAGAITDTQGCSLDEDVDGVADGVDRCPGTEYSVLVDRQGCANNQTARFTPPPVRRIETQPVARVAIPLPPAAVAKATAPESEQQSAAMPEPAPVSDVVVAAPPAEPMTARRQTEAALPAADQTVTATKPLPTRTISFESGGTELSRVSRRVLDDELGEIRSVLDQYPDAVLIVSGHADTRLDGADAQRLSAQRAVKVRNVLVGSGIPARRLHLQVPGVSQPRFSGGDLAKNARVELSIHHGRQIQASSGEFRQVQDRSSGAGASSSRVFFKRYSSTIEPAAAATLDVFARQSLQKMQARPGRRIYLAGAIGEDETGVGAYRLALSRAAAVRAYLVSAGINERLIYVAPGAADNAGSGSGRRVEFRLLEP
tara:strand:+ start:1894 stop:3216 length:1323 start_codon:yes stop_codon:yes gene_type:complete